MGFISRQFKRVTKYSLINPDKIIGKFVDLKDKENTK